MAPVPIRAAHQRRSPLSAATLPVAQGPAACVIHDNPEWIPSFEEPFAGAAVHFAVCEVPSGAEAPDRAEPDAGAEAGRVPATQQIVRFQGERLRA